MTEHPAHAFVRSEMADAAHRPMRASGSGTLRNAPTVDVSVIVPTYNRAGQLESVIRALLAQETDGVRFEVWVVDNASSDSTPAVVNRLAALDPRVHYLCETNRGASWARNAGIAHARGPIVAFIDDDLVLAPDWLQNLKQAFDANPDIDCVGGRVEPLWPARVPRWLTPRHFAPLALQLERPPLFDTEHASGCLGAGNFACRRHVFADIGTFATNFARDEDREFNLRLWRGGKRGMFAETVRVLAPIDPARLTKSYHRRWYETTGANHARVGYKEIIDHDGRLVPPLGGRRLFGIPLFLYKESLVAVAAWTGHAMRCDMSEAFYHECQLRYLFQYIRTRVRLLRSKPT